MEKEIVCSKNFTFLTLQLLIEVSNLPVLFCIPRNVTQFPKIGWSRAETTVSRKHALRPSAYLRITLLVMY